MSGKAQRKSYAEHVRVLTSTVTAYQNNRLSSGTNETERYAAEFANKASQSTNQIKTLASARTIRYEDRSLYYANMLKVVLASLVIAAIISLRAQSMHLQRNIIGGNGTHLTEDVNNRTKRGEKFEHRWDCSQKGGCYKGYCWAGCDATLHFGTWTYEEWCYTTLSYSQSFKYVRCSEDKDCDKCWKCAGSCTV